MPRWDFLREISTDYRLKRHNNFRKLQFHPLDDPILKVQVSMEQTKNQSSQSTSTLLDLEKYRLKLKLRDSGVEWHEDKAGKFKIWLRLGNSQAVQS
jgi:hypothetical protein